MTEPTSDQTIALCLSGGGFRAALFHLGALRRLHELGILERTTTISSVSGGSIVAGFLADRITARGTGATFADWERDVAAPFRRVCLHNMRTWPLLWSVLPPNWFRSGVAVATLERMYARHLTRRTLDQLPPRPHFVFCATDMTFGVNWTFERHRMGDWQAGYTRSVADVPIARAVAASSCFPPVFAPQVVPDAATLLKGGAVAHHPDRAALLAGLRLTDGGVYDNLGLEPAWKRHEVVLVSDGGSPFDTTGATPWWLRINRYVALIGKQSAAIRKRWLLSSYGTDSREGAYWGIGTATQPGDPGYAPAVRSSITRVRTDLDAFRASEAAILENHGYLVADSTVRKHAAMLLPPDMPPLTVPHPRWFVDATAQLALARSHEVRLVGRF